MEKKYKTLKNINAQELVAAKIACSYVCEFLRHYEYGSVDPQALIGKDWFGPCTEKWLIDHGYIEEVKTPMTYRLHDCFKMCNFPDAIYMICKTSNGFYCLIDINDFEFMGQQPIRIFNDSAITEEEFKKMVGSCYEDLTPVKVTITTEPVTE